MRRTTREAACSFRSCTWCSGRFSTAGLAPSVRRLQRSGDPGAASRTRGASASHPSPGDDADRSAVLDRGQSAPPARPLGGVHHHARDIASLASTLGGAPLDVPEPPWTSSASGRPSAGASVRTRECQMGLSAHRRRDERPWFLRLRDDGAHVAAGSRCRTGWDAPAG